MKTNSDTFQTSDGLTIHHFAWLPDDEPTGIVIIVHGIAEHIGRYPHVAEALVASGYAVYGLDHRGHGKSEGEQVYVERFDQYVEDLRQFFDLVKSNHPDQKMFIYGHSMGSLISLLFALRYQSELTGLLITGCAINVDEGVSPIVIGAGSLVARIAPRLRMIPSLPSENISRDPEAVQAYDNDPLVDRGAVRARTAAELLNAGRTIRERAAELTLPMLILHGGADKLTPPSGSQYMHEHVSSEDVTLKIYPDFRHEIHNEIGKEEVLSDIVRWLDKH